MPRSTNKWATSNQEMLATNYHPQPSYTSITIRRRKERQKSQGF